MTTEEKKKKQVAYVTEWRKKNPEKAREYNRRWKQNNKKRCVEIQMRYARRNPGKLQARRKKYRETHKEETKAYNRKISDSQNRSLPAQKRKFSKYKNGAKVRNIDFTLTFEEFSQALYDEDVKCTYCGTSERLGLDRMNNKVGYLVQNITPACWKCNRAKGTLENSEAFIQICLSVTKNQQALYGD